MYSTVTGAKSEDTELDAGYWARNLREPVQFARAVKAAIDDGYHVFLEVGPHPVLLGSLQQCIRAGKEGGHAIPTLRRGQGERRELLSALGALYTAGAPVAWEQLHAGQRQCVPLPPYPFQRERYWLEVTPKRHIVADYYDAFSAMGDGRARDGGGEGVLLTFGPLPEIVPGFSWLLAFTDPENNKQHAELMRSKQLELRAVLFRHVDFSSCARALDFGCGYATDLMSLGEKHAHLELDGYTLSSEQAGIGARRVRSASFKTASGSTGVTAREMRSRASMISSLASRSPTTSGTKRASFRTSAVT